jgi:hypothetical protein
MGGLNPKAVSVIPWLVPLTAPTRPFHGPPTNVSHVHHEEEVLGLLQPPASQASPDTTFRQDPPRRCDPADGLSYVPR